MVIGIGLGWRQFKPAGGWASSFRLSGAEAYFATDFFPGSVVHAAMNLDQDLATIARQENALCFEKFDEEIAWEIGKRLRAAAAERRAALAIDIFSGGHSLFTCTLPGSSPNNSNWLRRKRNTVLHFQRCSYGFGLQLQKENADLTAKFGLPLSDYAVHGGSFPIRLVNAGVIGAITVSGLPQREDHKLVVSVLIAFLGKSPAGLELE